MSHIDRMPLAEIRERILTLADPEAIGERIINDLVQEMIDMNMIRFEQIISGYIHSKGIEKTVIQIIFPFLEKIGLLWQNGHINPAQEHLVSNIIRQKLIVAIETTESHITLDKTFLLFLPEGEHHELGLLYMYYMLKSRGARTIYLGANVPFKDVVHVMQAKKPDVIFVHLTSTCPDFNFGKFLQDIIKYFSNIPVVISGQLTQGYKRKLPENVQFMRSLPEVVEFLSSL
jgi:methanogenic corrinoid protein MtbC1